MGKSLINLIHDQDRGLEHSSGEGISPSGLSFLILGRVFGSVRLRERDS
mgnify:CR=1 FL=1